MSLEVSRSYLYNVKNRILSLVLLALTISVWSCSSEKKSIDSQVVFEAVALDIDTAFIQGDTLFTRVSYSGGCGDHTFAIEPNGPMLKSLPPKQPMRIVHRSDGDPCRAMIIEELKYDISEYRGTPRGTTFILLENWKPTLSYSY